MHSTVCGARRSFGRSPEALWYCVVFVTNATFPLFVLSEQTTMDPVTVARRDSSFAREVQEREELELATAISLAPFDAPPPLKRQRTPPAAPRPKRAVRSDSAVARAIQDKEDHAAAVALATQPSSAVVATPYPKKQKAADSHAVCHDYIAPTVASCKHKCKDKSRCKHPCCKRNIPVRERKREEPGGFKLLRRRFTTKGWRMRDVVGDGACQFRALSQQLWGSEEHHWKVRGDVVAHLRTHPPPFLDERVYFSADSAVFDSSISSLDEYLDLMKESTTWGDQTTLQACADAYGVRIEMITTFEDHGNQDWLIRMEPAGQGATDSIRIGFHSEMHYVSTEN